MDRTIDEMRRDSASTLFSDCWWSRKPPYGERSRPFEGAGLLGYVQCQSRVLPIPSARQLGDWKGLHSPFRPLTQIISIESPTAIRLLFARHSFPRQPPLDYTLLCGIGECVNPRPRPLKLDLIGIRARSRGGGFRTGSRPRSHPP